jgi:drug/metabolite transporter (DMT)-like permease
LIVIGGSMQAAIALLSLSALAYIPAATLVFLFYTYPAWIALFAVLRGTEKVGRARRIALLVSFAGIAVMVGMPGAREINSLGVALALGTALLYAIYIPILGSLQRGSKPEVATFYVSFGALLVFLVLGLARRELDLDAPAVSWASMVALGVISTAASFALFLRGLSSLGPVRASIVATAEPFFAAILAALVLGQPIALPTAIGGALIAVAVVLLHRGESNSEATPSPV